MNDLPILAKCTRCGRGFLTLPAEWPAFDAYGRADGYRAGDPVCGGEMKLTPEGVLIDTERSTRRRRAWQ
jgi:hypothetical protein